MARLARIIAPAYPHHGPGASHARAGRPLGSERFVDTIGRVVGRDLRPRAQSA